MTGKYGFHGCIGMLDGTLFPLKYKSTHNGEEYFTQKGYYAINEFIFVNDMATVRYIMT